MKSQIFESVPGSLSDRARITVLFLNGPVVASWALETEHGTAHRRAIRAGRPVHAAAPYGQGSGAGRLGRYVPPLGRSAHPPRRSRRSRAVPASSGPTHPDAAPG
ncbi:hypothetical protein [Streptomyces prasinus]|uniref:hypothetical protein n=1 Tax=Streptomyces prasinus TaxID=67345 RepID=UPI002F40F28F